MITRNKCIITGETSLEHIRTFDQFPLKMGVSSVNDFDYANMSWHISPTGSIQLNPLIPYKILYAESHGSGSVGEVWEKHHRSFSNFIKMHDVREVLEIGAGHGILAKNTTENTNIQWNIIEPNPGDYNETINVIKGLFPEDVCDKGSINTIVHSHVLEHVYEPLDLLGHISEFLDDGELHIFSVPNMSVMLDKKYNNCLNFEHSYLLTENYTEYMLAKNNFRILNKEYYMDDHSIFYSCVKDTAVEQIELVNEYDKNKRLFINYLTHYDNLVAEFNSNIDNFEGNIYLFGGHIFSQYLLGFGLNSSRITNILDNDTNKQGKYLYGSDIKIISPKDIKPGSAIILRAGAYTEEIKEGILEHHSDVIFW